MEIIFTHCGTKRDKTLAELNEIIFHAPYDVEAYIMRADLNILAKCYESAIADLNIAINLQPACIQAWALRGHALYMSGNQERGLQDILTAANLNHEDSNVYKEVYPIPIIRLV